MTSDVLDRSCADRDDAGGGGVAASAHAGAADLPLVSVCISAYNVERFLGAALDSVLAQTYPRLEVILIDNGSEDRTYELAQSRHDERLRLVHVDENLGGYQAMNRVASMARGEFVAVYHSDDVYDPRIVEKEVALLRARPEVGAVFSLDHNINEDGRIFATIQMPRDFVGKTDLDYDTVFRYLVRNGCPFCCPTFMTRRSVLDTVGYFAPERWGIAADAEMWLRIARRFRIAILDEPLIGYRKGRHQWSARYRRLRTERDRLFAVIDHYMGEDGWRDRLRPEDLTEYEFQQCDDDTYRAANFLIQGDAGAARQLLRTRAYPWRTLLAGIRRRKVRLLALRAAMLGSLSLGAKRPLAHVLQRIGP